MCKQFGWDYYTYEKQPAWFIEELTIIMNQEALKEKKELEKVKKTPKVPRLPKVRVRRHYG
ncbi:MAG: hypothetical protein ACTSYW_10510 [Candidatus Heimdallarchaeota archaeon]